MDRALYISMSGASHNMLQQAVRSHNLANASTTGFKADLANAMAKPILGGDGYASRVYAVAESNTANYAPGSLVQTGRDLDVAIDGEGWMAVESADGREAYARGGNLHVDVLGILRNERGLPVQGNGGVINVPEAEKIEIGADGTISVRALGQGPETLVAVDRIRLVNPDVANLRKEGDGLIYSVEGTEKLDPSVRLAKGFLESSNVSAVEELMSVTSLARQFEMQIKMMQTVAENAESSARVLQVQV